MGDKGKAAISTLTKAGKIISWNESAGEEYLLKTLKGSSEISASISPAFSGLRMRQIRKNGQRYLILFNESETSFQGTVNWKVVEEGTMIDMESGASQIWNPQNELSLAPHACIALSAADK